MDENGIITFTCLAITTYVARHFGEVAILVARSHACLGNRPGDLILVQHQYNNCTTIPHMRVDPSMWDPPSCEGLLYSCCIGVVNLTFSIGLHVWLVLCG
jgi:hypothetical protein